ncbi:MAG: class I SAM-dependent methyltransferase [Nanoarchaeota archaeon]|nr:class I SAM-dependent methyltransferase [Nanoarchaeota archaeon]
MIKITKERSDKVYGLWSRVYDLSHHLQTLWTDTKYRKAVIKYTNLKKDDNVLDVGAGTGLTSIEAHKIHPSCKITGLDLSGKMIEKAKSKYGLEKDICFIVGNMENLKLEDNTFDVILSCYGLGGVYNIKRAFEEMVRVAKPNARFVCVEMSEPPKEDKFKWWVHKHFVGPYIKCLWNFRDLNLHPLFKNYGIEIKEQKYFNDRIFGSTTLVSGILRK